MRKLTIGLCLGLWLFTACENANPTPPKETDQKELKATNETQDQEKKASQEENYPSTFTDSRDGKEYQVVKIGEQVWMAENLAYKPESGNFWAYENKASNVEQYGYLYDFETAKQVVPEGWRLPSKDDLEALVAHYGADSKTAFEKMSADANGLKMEYSGWWYQESNQFSRMGDEVGFWSSTPNTEDEAWVCVVDAAFKHLDIDDRAKNGVGATVRLIKE